MDIDHGQQPVDTAAPIKPKKHKRQFGLGTVFGAVMVVGIAAFIGGTRTGDVWAMLGGSQNGDLPGQLDLSSVQQVYGNLRAEFDGQLDTQALIDGAKKGLVDAAGDPYTVYFTNEEAEQFMNDLDGKFSGIGAELDKRGGNLIIRSTLDDSPARKAGLMEGDIIAGVNDEDTVDWPIEQAVATIRGEAGTTVKLTIVRGQEVKEVPIVRAEIVNPSVRWEVTGDNTGYIRVSRFADDTAPLMQDAATEFRQKNLKGVVLDLRGNGGGYLNVAQEVSSLWLEQGQLIVEERRGDTVTEVLKASGNPLLAAIPTVVLIDGGSASASEIVAGALRDHGAATLVGEKSFGKGSVQQLLDIASGGKLKVTVAKWFTPNGVNISEAGVAPDHTVGLSSDDVLQNRDPQKAKAQELLKN